MRVTRAQWEGVVPSGKEAMWILAGQVDAAVIKLSCVDFFCSHACAFLSFVFCKELLMSRFFIRSLYVTFEHSYLFCELVMLRN